MLWEAFLWSSSLSENNPQVIQGIRREKSKQFKWWYIMQPKMAVNLLCGSIHE